jgi:antitoxin component of MazEF toxin-antitoxin module
MAQKFIKIGSSVGAVIPAEMLKNLGIEQGEEFTPIQQQNGDIVLKRNPRGQNKDVSDAVIRATAYIEKYRKDFEALSDK